MSEGIVKIAVAKFGCIGAAPLLDLILDERADRDDLEVRGYTSGAKLDPESCSAIVEDIIGYEPDIVIISSPNAALPGPTQARDTFSEKGLASITLSDGPSKKAFIGKDDDGNKIFKVADNQGFIVLPCDPMIGARREFLDPSEMSLFNADVIKVHAVTGVTRFLQVALDKVVSEIKLGETLEMPRLVAEAEDVVAATQFANPYSVAKAIAALGIVESVAKLTTKGCFMVKEAERYVPLVAAGHETLRAAVKLADEIRELEKSVDGVLRTPHSAHGNTRKATSLGEKPA